MKFIPSAIFIIVSLFLTLTLKKNREFALPVSLVAGASVLAFSLISLNSSFSELKSSIIFDTETTEYLIKVTLVSLLCNFFSSLCADKGESALAFSMDIMGKCTLIMLSLPFFTKLISLISSLTGVDS